MMINYTFNTILLLMSSLNSFYLTVFPEMCVCVCTLRINSILFTVQNLEINGSFSAPFAVNGVAHSAAMYKQYKHIEACQLCSIFVEFVLINFQVAISRSNSMHTNTSV